MNSVVENSITRDVNVQGSTSGFMTKFQVAKELGMTVESDEFKTVLAEIPCDDEWDVQNHMERSFSKAGLKRYHWDMKALSVQSKEEEHSESASAVSVAKKSKLNVFDEAEKVSVQMNIVINNPEWHKAQEDARLLQTFSHKIQCVSDDLKELISKFATVAQPDASTLTRRNDLDASLRQVFDFEMEIVSFVGRAPSLDKNDIEGNKLFCEHADAKRSEIVACVNAAEIAIKKANSYLASF